MHSSLVRYLLVFCTLLLLSPSFAEAAQYTVSGKFSYKGLDNQLHPGWNWLVKLWWEKPNGNWKDLGSRYIPPDGNWSISFNESGYKGQNLRIQYRAGSYFVMFQRENESEYWWGDPVQSNISNNFNIGHRVADTSTGGTVAGLGDVQYNAYRYWNKFMAAGINPERSDQIDVFFPNDFFDCGDGSGNPWSCASKGGDIWLIGSHTNETVIMHELAHQTNNEFWGNKGPPGEGGSHLLSNCYNDGLALSEGYANAVPMWVIYGEKADSAPLSGSIDVESPDPSTICNGDTNETWVAAAFWDLLDHHSDDVDSTDGASDALYFVNPAHVFALYFDAGVQNGMKNFRQIYRNASSTGHEPYIDEIYENNTISVP